MWSSSTASSLSDHQLNQIVFVQPDPGRLLCPIESCGRRYAQAKALYKHYRQKSDALHKKFALAFGGRSCDFCHEDFKRLYDLERHIIKAHKSLPPTAEDLNSLKSTPQFTELQLRQRNVDSNPTIPALRPSKGQASLLCSDRCKCGHRANPHQPCRSGNGGPAPWIEASANSGNTKAIQPDDLVSRPYPPIQESVQNECSTNWRNTVMSPQNDPQYSCNHQPFLSKGKGLANELGPSATSIGTSDSSPVPLLSLLYSLGCSEIREDILFCGLFPQKRWNDHGNVQEVTLRDAGLNGQIACLFSSKVTLAQTIETCIQLGLIVSDVLADDSLAYSLSDQSRHQISESFKNEDLSLLGLIFTAHIYPRDQTLEPS